jgi:hypothetical protein
MAWAISLDGRLGAAVSLPLSTKICIARQATLAGPQIVARGQSSHGAGWTTALDDHRDPGSELVVGAMIERHPGNLAEARAWIRYSHHGEARSPTGQFLPLTIMKWQHQSGHSRTI